MSEANNLPGNVACAWRALGVCFVGRSDGRSSSLVSGLIDRRLKSLRTFPRKCPGITQQTAGGLN
eukprot:16412956-Heterocapsa_arctica.AAC.1